jgi:hypothetical protein
VVGSDWIIAGEEGGVQDRQQVQPPIRWEGILFDKGPEKQNSRPYTELGLGINRAITADQIVHLIWQWTR